MNNKFEKITKKLIEKFSTISEKRGKFVIYIYQEIHTPNVFGEPNNSINGHLLFEASGGAKVSKRINENEYLLWLNGEEFIVRREETVR